MKVTKNIKTKKQLSWVNMSISEMDKFAVDYTAHKKLVYKKVKDILPENRTFKNTVLEIENSDGVYGDKSLQMHLLSQVHPDKKLREAASRIEISLHQKLIDIELDPDLYTALVEYEMGNYENGKNGLEKLDAVDKKLFTDMIRAYRRMGFDLSNEKQKELKAKFKILSKLGTEFRNNINKYDDYILCSLEELDGCSERFIGILPQVKFKNKTKYKVTLAYPHIGPFLANANNRELRKELANKNNKKGGQKNLDILEKMVEERIAVSKLLGHKNYIDYKVEDRMAKNSKKVFSFINDLLIKSSPLVKKDIKDLQDFAKTLGIKKLETYDIAYVQNRLKKQKYNIDTESLRSYFPVHHVLDTLFSTASELFGINFVYKKTTLWHADAMHIEVHDTKTKKHLANLLLDLYPRTGKYGHAAAFDTQYHDIKTVTLVCNFPSLLSIGEVETLYHEFGHALHFMLADTKYSSHNGFGVAWDFVETPSQMMENFVWHKKGLEKLSKNNVSGKSLDKITIEKILQSKNFMSGLFVASQLVNARLDLDIHMGPGKLAGKKYNQYYNSLYKKYIGLDKSTDSLFPASFGHLDGYDAGYYSYMWALVYAQDFFSVFENRGVFSKSVGAKYRKEILEVGSSRDEVLSAQKFLGRELNSEAFLKGLGIEV